MTALELLPSLERVSSRGHGKWSAKCPAHADRSPSLSVAEGERGILIKCWAGCTLEAIMNALGLRIADLFSDAVAIKGRRPFLQTFFRLDPRVMAFRLELYALDLRLRAERVRTALKRFSQMTLTIMTESGL